MNTHTHQTAGPRTRLPARIAVSGPTSSGKTTLARRLAVLTGAPHIELDSLYHGPGWTPTEDFVEQVAAATAGAAWITDGNYRLARDYTWARADLIIWLDFPLPLTFWRLARRTFGRWWHGEVLWNGNRETLRNHFLSKDSLFLWALQTHWRHRREYPQQFRAVGARNVVRLRSPRELERWLARQTT
jgi:adenylate kinase family enzyme